MSLPTRRTLNLTFSQGLSLEGGVAGILRRLRGSVKRLVPSGLTGPEWLRPLLPWRGSQCSAQEGVLISDSNV